MPENQPQKQKKACCGYQRADYFYLVVFVFLYNGKPQQYHSYGQQPVKHTADSGCGLYNGNAHHYIILLL